MVAAANWLTMFGHIDRRLNAAGKSRSPSDAGGEYQELAGGAIQMLQEKVAKGAPLEIALRTVDLRLITQWLQAYLGQHADYDQAFTAIASSDQALRPAHFEVSFGLKPRSNEELDPLSTETPFELLCDGDTIRFSGRIDRIDIGVVGGQLVFNILDYKTGNSKKFKSRNAETGVSLQPASVRARGAGIVDDRSSRRPLASRLLVFKRKWFRCSPACRNSSSVPKSECAKTADWQTLRGSLLNRVGSLVRGIREGSFPVFNPDESCTSRCAYSTICRIGQIRSLGKTWVPRNAE